VSAILAVAALGFASSPPVATETQIVLLALGVAILGLPHGALDIHVLRQEMGERPGFWPSAGLVAAYVAAALLVLVLWQLQPRAALLAFLLVSAAHFGQIDDPNGQRAARGLPRLLQVAARGLIPIAVPSFFRAAETTALYNELLGVPHALAVEEVRGLAQVALAVLGLALAAEIVGGIWSPARRRLHAWSVFTMGVTVGLFVLAPPLVAFGLYFCLWHSAAHSIDLAGRLDGTSPRRGFFRFAVAAALGTSAALVALVATGVWLAADVGGAGAAVRVIFIGLSCLTAPHVLLSAWAARPRAVS
jgi:Brp/Blh family beta-carotene 15,15'-monooxygenase